MSKTTKTGNDRALAQIARILPGVEVYDNGRQSWFVCNGMVVCWYVQDGEPTCINVRRENDHDDPQTDYFAGRYVDSVQQAIKCVATSERTFYRGTDALNLSVRLCWAKGNGFKRQASFHASRLVANPDARSDYSRGRMVYWSFDATDAEALSMAEAFIAGDLPTEILLDWLADRDDLFAALLARPRYQREG